MSELGKKYGDQLKEESLDATTRENAAKQAGLGFQSHGLLIRDKSGEIVFKQADHAVNKDEVAAFVAEKLGKK